MIYSKIRINNSTELTMSLTWVIAIILIAAMLAYFIYKIVHSDKKKQSTETAPPKKTEPNSSESILRLNLDLRKSTIPVKLILATEDVIDKLVELIPKVESCDSISGDLSWTVNRIANEYLPHKCVAPFLRLDENLRSSPSKTEVYLNNLSVLSAELDDVTSILSNKNINEFDAKAKFLSHRFNTTAGEN
jgi:hypothetical protein